MDIDQAMKTGKQLWIPRNSSAPTFTEKFLILSGSLL